MNFPDIYSKIQEHMAATLALAAIGAELRLRQNGLDGDPRMRDTLQTLVAQFVPPDALDSLEPGQLAMLAGQVSYSLQEGLDLIREPERAPGWTYTDPSVLQERGRGSRSAALSFRSMAQTRPALKAILENDCRFLDVGTGVGWLSIQAAQLWPKMQIVGLDIHEPALKLAEANISESGLSDRIALRKQSITALGSDGLYNLVWFPSMFMPEFVVRQALPLIYQALAPDGMLIFAMFAPAPGPYGETTRDLLTVRSGGHPWSLPDLEALLSATGFRNLEFVNSGATACTMLAQR